MKCTFCENELTSEMLRAKGCGSCVGGCRKIHCPYCGQENPAVPELLEKFITSNTYSDKDISKKGNNA